ncbi:DUF6058 family natural product biosynthesis protein [Shewanella sedimentimangrovi]|uniref:Orphan protein n=1 Tax=Shewanella sedimentimangrovi TaxID=2814293 RepID=A0ABX7R3F2_9GAMM|nr:DUF6058 family natural product biosynthesis protein [Shewanella sedimentimangrovi]QSX38342.1 hypothetical protein JYB85_05825 [Shewanella sedimentimangrovi]
MELLDYLNNQFLTLQQLLETTQVSEAELRRFQDGLLMPKASYRLELNLNCDSFFGQHQQSESLEYYAKGYASWLGMLKANDDSPAVYQAFSSRYTAKLAQLKTEGFASDDPRVNEELPAHIDKEWQSFLTGTYGLCTRSGLPEDIATKELAVIRINELFSRDALTDTELAQLARAVDLLDRASSAFAPHERQRSSREQLINEVRRKYQLKAG